MLRLRRSGGCSRNASNWARGGCLMQSPADVSGREDMSEAFQRAPPASKLPLIGPMSVAEIGVYLALELLVCREPPDVLGDAGGQERFGHLLGVGGVRGDQAVREIPQRMARRQRFGISHVQGCAADLVRAQCP